MKEILLFMLLFLSTITYSQYTYNFNLINENDCPISFTFIGETGIYTVLPNKSLQIERNLYSDTVLVAIAKPIVTEFGDVCGCKNKKIDTSEKILIPLILYDNINNVYYYKIWNSLKSIIISKEFCNYAYQSKRIYIRDSPSFVEFRKTLSSSKYKL